MGDKGIITVLSGFSGAGKGTLMKHLLKTHPNDYCLSISATTRAMRMGEAEGREYFFKTRQEFDKMIENGEFLEYATFNGNSYGTPKSYVEEVANSGKDIFLEIEVQGALQVKKIFPDALLLFVMPPSADELKERLLGRGTEDEETISQRLSISVRESGLIVNYDYIIINDEVESATERIHNIIRSEHLRINRNQKLINAIKKDLLKYSGN